MNVVAPLTLQGGGHYALHAVKEIKVSEDFLELDMETRKCQNKESFEDCSTRMYLEELEDKCHCVQYKLRNFTIENQVQYES